MGSASSKFKKYLQHGDEYAAMQVYQSNPEIRKTLQPSFSYGDNYDHYTPLHYAARHGMKHLIRAFLNDLNGNPNKTNVYGQTALHCVCQVNRQKSLSALERRSYSVILLLSWRGPVMSNGERERVEVSKRDNFGYTALHYASKSGLKKCVEYLVAHGADLFVENSEGMTPCDLAIKENNHQIALFLESKMVFSSTPESVSGESRGGARTSSCEDGGSEEEVYSGLRAQDLQEAKDQLLVETADMLHIPLFTAEVLLRHSEWSRETLLDQWIRDPIATCHLAGVQPPSSSSFNTSIDTTLGEDEYLCEICCDLMDSEGTQLGCRHKFCKNCWKNYLHTKIREGNAHQIFCPAFDCTILVPVEIIERTVSPEMAKKYLTFDINAFVDTNKSIKWCPYPGCNRAVNLPENERKPLEYSSGLPPMSHAVDCGAGHFFCFECGREAHAPIGCSAWRSWLTKVSSVDPSELKSSSLEYQEAANCLWLITNSKPCPNCKSPIQKTDGCNHMKCSKCRFDFCWVCLESWKKHSSGTGGYFRCNRFIHAINNNNVKEEMADKMKKTREMSRFIHFFTRFKNHENSQTMEELLMNSAKKKRELLQSSLSYKEGTKQRRSSSSTNSEEDLRKNTKFYEDGVWELIKARSVLRASYVYGFYLEDRKSDCKTIFEFMQNELEEVTEYLSEMIARPYLRTPRKTIIRTIQKVRRKRQEFLRGAYRGFLPPEQQQKTSSSSSRMGNEDPWIKQEESGDDIPNETFHSSHSHSSRYCRRPGCQRPRAMRHSQSGGGSSMKNRFSSSRDWIEFCSMQCAERFYQRYHRRKLVVSGGDDDHIDMDLEIHEDSNPDYSRSLTIALELSRMQMIQDGLDNVIISSNKNIKGRSRPSTLPRASRSDDNILADDPQLNLAIELSLKDLKKKKGGQIKKESSSYCSSAEKYCNPSPGLADSADQTVNNFLKSLRSKDEVGHMRKDSKEDLVKDECLDESLSSAFSRGRSASTGDIIDSDDYLDTSAKVSSISREVEESSTSTSTTLKETITSSKETITPQNVSSLVQDPLTQSMRRNRPKFVRQKSFEIDSDSTDMEMSLTEESLSITKKDKEKEVDNKVDSKEESEPSSKPPVSPTKPTNARYVHKCPGLTIQIIKDDDETEEVKLVDETPQSEQPHSTSSVGIMSNKSPTIHISGVSISRTGPGTPDRPSNQLQQQYSPRSSPYSAIISAATAAASTAAAPAATSAASILAEATQRQHRSSSLIVPARSTPPKSPGSKSLHLSRASSPSAEIRLLTLPRNVQFSANSISPRGCGSGSVSLGFSSVELPPTSPLTSVPSPHSAKSLKGDKFTFPSSSGKCITPLSSVLHVQDCYLSSDDFHEALFLEKSPKSVHKRRRKSKNHHHSTSSNISTSSISNGGGVFCSSSINNCVFASSGANNTNGSGSSSQN
ncbi:uncharacterized protein [Lepeophtheirus salmonis]|uniref:uncharacterized protein n=1 Tax=Lepeophtheirus salmonis TaxID=72036 RepID=UPI001AE354F5|nr:ankyrin repeat and IBR domain-containing protein 1-like [Lepeophtheirus salmonis]